MLLKSLLGDLLMALFLGGLGIVVWGGAEPRSFPYAVAGVVFALLFALDIALAMHDSKNRHDPFQ